MSLYFFFSKYFVILVEQIFQIIVNYFLVHIAVYSEFKINIQWAGQNPLKEISWLKNQLNPSRIDKKTAKAWKSREEFLRPDISYWQRCSRKHRWLRPTIERQATPSCTSFILFSLAILTVSFQGKDLTPLSFRMEFSNSIQYLILHLFSFLSGWFFWWFVIFSFVLSQYPQYHQYFAANSVVTNGFSLFNLVIWYFLYFSNLQMEIKI